jgi:hypothetical protein
MFDDPAVERIVLRNERLVAIFYASSRTLWPLSTLLGRLARGLGTAAFGAMT